MIEKIKIGKEQAKMFAELVCADIAQYIEDHREEYERFLKEEYDGLEDIE